MNLRCDWTFNEINEIFKKPALELLRDASVIHKENHDPNTIDLSKLISIKTGKCPEDCAYCAQSSHHNTEIESEPMMKLDDVLEIAKKAKEDGIRRVCLGSAQTKVRDNKDFDNLLEIVRTIRKMNLECCCTLGMLTLDQAKKLKEAGVHGYNHNIDTSKEFYSKIVTTRSYEDRLNTLKNIKNANLEVCSGGILGMGESDDDRISMLQTLSNLNPHPETVPVNALVPIKGTPLEDRPKINIWEIVRFIATARILMPKSKICLGAGRSEMDLEDQSLCFLAGVTSIFAGDKLLTAKNAGSDRDSTMLKTLGLKKRGEMNV
jgi:biotin synthase